MTANPSPHVTSSGDSPDQPPTGQSSTCSRCGSAVARDAAFCEACGAPQSPTAEPTEISDADLESPIELTRSTQLDRAAGSTEPTELSKPCADCGGVIGGDGYCETCGSKPVSERDHYCEQPASWIAGCCDKGIRHSRNEDAIALAGEPEPGSRAVLIVCDGVSTSADSDVASLAGARRARDVLAAHQPAGMGPPASKSGALAGALTDAVAQANAAVIEHTAADSDNAASCTFAGAMVEGDLIVFGNVGDSRVYWLPDGEGSLPPTELSRDDSVAQARIEMGVSREEAENGPQAHAITKWLGRDSPDFTPRTGSITVDAPGWLMVCSDGLWNYASEAAQLQAVVADLSQTRTGPLELTQALVAWANTQGGKDNISVALARMEPVSG